MDLDGERRVIPIIFTCLCYFRLAIICFYSIFVFREINYFFFRLNGSHCGQSTCFLIERAADLHACSSQDGQEYLGSEASC
jgi:hypothetical protein